MSEQDLQALGTLDYGVAGDTTDYVRVAQEGLDSVPPASSTGATDDSLAKIKATIMAFEGDGKKFDSNGNFVAYPDSYKVPTIAFGFTEGVSLGDTMTVEEAEERLDREILSHRDDLFSELATGVAFLRKGRNSSNVIDAEQFGFTGNDATEYQNNYGDGFQYDWTNNAEDYAPLPEGVTEPYVRVIKDGGKDYERFVTWDGETKTISGKGQTVFYGYRNREELLAVGESKYNALDEDTQTSLVSLVYNMGSLGPEVLSVANQVVETGNKLPLAEIISRMPEQYDKGVEGLEIRRNEEANIIKNGYSQRVADHAETGVLKKYGIKNPFESTTSTTAPQSGGGGSRGQLPSSVGGFNVGQQMMNEATTAERDPMTGDEFNQVAKGIGLEIESPLLPDETLLGEQYGAFGMFMYERDQEQDLLFGIDANGKPVAFNDPSAIFKQSLVGYLEKNITGAQIDPNSEEGQMIIAGLLRKTKWGTENNSRMREFDVEWAKLNEVDRLAMIQTTIDLAQDAARQIGYDLSEEEVFDLAHDFQRLNGAVTEWSRGKLFKAVFAAVENKTMANDLTDFQSQVEANLVKAGDYYLNMSEEQARDYAEKMFTGELSTEEFNQILQNQAKIEYPHLEAQATELGVSLKDLMFNKETAIENLLGKKVDLRDSKWNPILSHVDSATGNVRALTTWETENYVRGTEDYLVSNKGQDSIYKLVNSLAETFGRV